MKNLAKLILGLCLSTMLVFNNVDAMKRLNPGWRQESENPNKRRCLGLFINSDESNFNWIQTKDGVVLNRSDILELERTTTDFRQIESGMMKRKSLRKKYSFRGFYDPRNPRVFIDGIKAEMTEDRKINIDGAIIRIKKEILKERICILPTLIERTKALIQEKHNLLQQRSLQIAPKPRELGSFEAVTSEEVSEQENSQIREITVLKQEELDLEKLLSKLECFLEYSKSQQCNEDVGLLNIPGFDDDGIVLRAKVPYLHRLIKRISSLYDENGKIWNVLVNPIEMLVKGLLREDGKCKVRELKRTLITVLLAVERMNLKQHRFAADLKLQIENLFEKIKNRNEADVFDISIVPRPRFCQRHEKAVKISIVGATAGAILLGAATCPPALVPYLTMCGTTVSFARNFYTLGKYFGVVGDGNVGGSQAAMAGVSLGISVLPLGYVASSVTHGALGVASYLPGVGELADASVSYVPVAGAVLGTGLSSGVMAMNVYDSSGALAGELARGNCSSLDVLNATCGLTAAVSSGIGIAQRFMSKSLPVENEVSQISESDAHQECVDASLHQCPKTGKTGIASKDVNPECAIEASQSCRVQSGIEPLHYCVVPGQTPDMSHPDCKGVRYQQGEPLVVCKPLQTLEGKDFEPDSDYIRGCNDAIKAQEDNVYLVLNPGPQDVDLIDQMEYNVCHEGADKITCHRVENNQAVTTCEFKADKSAVACRQFALSGKQKGSYVIKHDDGQVYTKDGAPLTLPTCLPGEDVIAQEYARLLTKPWVAYHFFGDVIEITQAESPTLYNLIKNQCDMIPLLRNKPMKFWIKNSADNNAMASYNNLWITKGKMDLIVANQGMLQDLKETIGHEVGHSRQHYSGDYGYLNAINLQDDVQKEGYMKLVNCEANADLHGALASADSAFSARTYYQYAKHRACGKDIHYVGHKLAVCGKDQQLPDFGVTLQEAKVEHPSRSEVEQAYGVHPDSMEDRIPAMLEVTEKLQVSADLFGA